MNIQTIRDRLHLDRATVRLTLTHLAIIMSMSAGFSIIFYHTSSAQLDRPLPHGHGYESRLFGLDDAGERHLGRAGLEALLDERAQEGRKALVRRLLLVNGLALVAGLAVSYLLARRNLEPIERAMDAQNQFVGDVSHELRTPLTALLASNEVALRQPKLSQAEARELITHNVVEVQKLHRLTNAMLDLLKDDTQLLQLRSVPVQDAVRDAMNSVVQLATDKHIAIDDAVGAQYAFADTIALTRVATILLDNAIKYSPRTSTIRIVSEARGKQLLLRIRDQGAGIDPQDMPHIFTRLYRADKARGASSANGYGLGLAIAKQLVEHMHGTISVESIPGGGSTFTVVLPLAKTA